jgi:hypothetical protein
MPSETLHIGIGTKFAAAFATFITVFANPTAGLVLSADITLSLAPEIHPPDSPSPIAVLVILGISLTVVILGQVFINLALGPRRTRGSAARFLRYQLGSLGIGAGCGLCIISVTLGSNRVVGAAGVGAGALIFGVSLLAFKSSRARPRARTQRPNTVVAEAEVIELWSGHFLRLPNPQMAVIRFTDNEERGRFVRHIVRQRSTETGANGMVEIDRRRPTRAPHFIVEPPRTTPPRNHLGGHS